MSVKKTDYSADVIAESCPIEHPAITGETNTNGKIVDIHKIPNRETDWDGMRNNDMEVVAERIVQLELKVGEKGWDPNTSSYTLVPKNGTNPSYDKLSSGSQTVEHGGTQTRVLNAASVVGLADGDDHSTAIAKLQRAIVDLANRLGVALPNANTPISTDTVPNFNGATNVGNAKLAASTLTTFNESLNSSSPFYFNNASTLSEAIVQLDYALNHLALRVEEKLGAIDLTALVQRVTDLETWKATAVIAISTTLPNATTAVQTNLDNHIKTLVNTNTPSTSAPSTVHGSGSAAGKNAGTSQNEVPIIGTTFTVDQAVVTDNSGYLKTEARVVSGGSPSGESPSGSLRGVRQSSFLDLQYKSGIYIAAAKPDPQGDWTSFKDFEFIDCSAEIGPHASTKYWKITPGPVSDSWIFEKNLKSLFSLPGFKIDFYIKYISMVDRGYINNGLFFNYATIVRNWQDDFSTLPSDDDITYFNVGTEWVTGGVTLPKVEGSGYYASQDLGNIYSVSCGASGDKQHRYTLDFNDLENIIFKYDGIYDSMYVSTFEASDGVGYKYSYIQDASPEGEEELASRNSWTLANAFEISLLLSKRT